MPRETTLMTARLSEYNERATPFIREGCATFLRHVWRCEPDTPGALLFTDNAQTELLAFAVHSSEILRMVSFLILLPCRPFEVNCVLCRDFVLLTPANRSTLSPLIQLRQLLESLSADKSFMEPVYDSNKDLTADNQSSHFACYKAVYIYYNQTHSAF